MKRLLTVCLIGLGLSVQGVAQVSSNIHTAPDINSVTLDYYLPGGVTFDPAVPLPSEVLGFEVGFRHARSEQIMAYMHALAEASDRVEIQQYATSYGFRPLNLVMISAPENMNRLEEIRTQHLQLADPSVSGSLDLSSMPAIIWQGFSVHGNEPSAANSSILLAYFLAAAQGPEVEEILRESVTIIDPILNPDGHDRFTHWANMHVGMNAVSDPSHREHLEVWPGGRTNHYWFDPNRDWMPVQHPESRGRIVQYHNWKPTILNDYHEMGTNSPYFFQPGVPSRNNPLTPERTFELTEQIARFHADALDEVGSLYWTRETFDDFYIGKGSTYPDINGSIGILYEQGSSRGHAQDSDYGLLTFPFTIRNQFITTISTMRAGVALREDLLEHQREFFRSALEEAGRSDVKGYVFSEPADPARVWHLLDILGHHQVDVYALNRTMTVDGTTFEAGKAFVVPAGQIQYRFLTSLFEVRTAFEDSLFYDVSTWNLPFAFDLPYAEVRGRTWSSNLLGEQVARYPDFPHGELIAAGEGQTYAYAFTWDSYYAPRAANRLLSEGVVVQVASRPFEAATASGTVEFDYGTIVVPMGVQHPDKFDEINELIQQIADEDAVTVYALESGLSSTGIDIGSRNFNLLRKPEVMILGGSGVTPNDVGEVWHLLDRRYDMQLSIVEIPRFNSISLSRYNTIVMVNGSYGDISDPAVDKLKRWVSDGGTLILQRGAVSWASRAGLINVDFSSSDIDTDRSFLASYTDVSGERGAQVIGGSIFNLDIDTQHPLFYGYQRNKLTVFRNNTLMLEQPENRYAMPARYHETTPLASGYISSENQERIKGTAGLIVGAMGSGRIIIQPHNTSFRGFWFGTNKLLANGIFFGHTINGQATQR